MNNQKVVELAQKVWSAAGGTVYIGPSIGLLAEFAALVERELRGCAKPVAWMGVDIEGNPNKFRLNFFDGSVPSFTATEDMKLIETREKHGSPCPEFWDWLPRAYNFNGDGSFTKYNMEVAFLAGKNSSPAPSVVRQQLTDEQIDALLLPESGTGTIRDLVRIIEAAHGIGGNDD